MLVLLQVRTQVQEASTATARNPCEGLPCGRSWHTLTRISPTAAVLFGGYDSDWTPLCDCWLLDTARCRAAAAPGQGPLGEPTSLWRRCRHQEMSPHYDGSARLWHAAVLEPVSRRLWVIGGILNDLMRIHSGEIEHPWQMLTMSFSSAAPLRLIAMEAALQSKMPDHPEVRALPGILLGEFESRRANFLEERRTGILDSESS